MCEGCDVKESYGYTWVLSEASVLQERIALASTISALEDQTRDSSYSTAMEDNILPIGAEDMGSGRESFG